MAVSPPGFIGALPLLARLFAGTFDGSPRVRRLQGAHFLVERPAPGLIHTDGETHATGASVVISVRPRSLLLLVPAGCRVTSSARLFPSNHGQETSQGPNSDYL